MAVVHEVETIARPIVDARGAFIIDIELRGNQGGKIVEVFIDTDAGVSTDLCAEISRELSHALDAANIIKYRYHLVVSSPGIDRPLKFLRQYSQHNGRRLTVKHRVNGAAVTSEGELAGLENDVILLRSDSGEILPVSFDSIIESRVKSVW
jgi:ribosome maturation factor RimP